MRRNRVIRWASAAAVLSLALSACGSDDTPDTVDEASDGVDGGVNGGGNGDYAFGTDEDQIAQSIAAAFQSRGGEARWEGNTLVLSLDEETTGSMPGFSECLVLDQLLNDGDESIVEFSDIRVSCAEVLAHD